jgi:predicted DNA-binding protein
MTIAEKPIRQSVSLPARLARRVRALAKNRKTSTNRVLVELIETGIESKEAEKSRFFELADQLSATSDPAERKQIKEKLARMTFGESMPKMQ